MVADGVTRARLPADNEVVCALGDPAVAGDRDAAAARPARRRRSSSGAPRLAGAIVAIGNAPTALFRLLEMLDAGAPPPAAIIGMPVGFVGAAESKEALIADGSLPYHRDAREASGGSAMAAAAINALASESGMSLSRPAGRRPLWRRARPRRSRAASP